MQSDPDLAHSLDLARRLACGVVPDADPDLAAWDLLVPLTEAVDALGVQQHDLDWDGWSVAPADVDRVLTEAARRAREARAS